MLEELLYTLEVYCGAVDSMLKKLQYSSEDYCGVLVSIIRNSSTN